MVTLSMFVVAVPIIMLMSGVSSFVGRRKHLLSTLLSLEYIMLSVFWLMILMISLLGGDSYFVLFFLTLAACEGALGLALLVSVVRTHGNDNFSSFVSLQC
uniref:NADH-ubiquinone oxidoreductase chain 4L n=1 Tax=Caridina cf. nilotica HMG-2016 TaxID=1844717 RepID=A0A182BT58_9EUCA|nr:NADH dehydrogenase subunit 4L [Caridina cf. nilotica HMG-2016]ANC75342.1 NADH dehydrogenase subunit 4L [Caridina cf. nilotica HMG-2016]